MYEAKPKKCYFYIGILLLIIFVCFLWMAVRVDEFYCYFFVFLLEEPLLLTLSIYNFLVYLKKRLIVNKESLVLIPVIKKRQIISYCEITCIIIYNNGMMRIYKGKKRFTISSAYEQYNEIVQFFINNLPSKI